MNLSRHPIMRAIYDACQAVEACGASVALTAAVTAVGNITPHAERLLDEWERECRDADEVLRALGLSPAEYRTEGGSLSLPKILQAIRPTVSENAENGTPAP
jgi:hypothetical protein